MNEEKLENLVGKELIKNKIKITVAESCTGGLLSHLLTNVPGSSEYYLGGIIAYSYEAKERLLGVNYNTLFRYGAVSYETVIEMADGVRKILSNDFPIANTVGIAISGIAGPGGGLPGKPVGLVWIGLSANEGNFAWRYQWNGSREENKAQSAHQALQLLYAYMQGSLPPENNYNDCP